MVKSQAVIDSIPFDRPGSPVFFDGLGEIRPHELGATFAPLRIVLAEDHSLRGAWLKAAEEMIDLAAQAVDGVATVALEEGNGDQSEQIGGGISSIAAPEALMLWIRNIKQQEGIRQMAVGNRMAGSAPLAEQD